MMEVLLTTIFQETFENILYDIHHNAYSLKEASIILLGMYISFRRKKDNT